MWNALTVDVEDYFHTEAMTQVAPRDRWSKMDLHVEKNTWKLLELFDRHGVRATMFFLGWIAARCPGLVTAAVAAGHEVACHSYWHRPVCQLTPDEFRADTLQAKEIIEAAAGVEVVGYRAPSFSILKGMDWATDILTDLGFLYSSSCHPIRHDLFNNPTAPRAPYFTRSGLLEIPITTWRLFGRNLPVGGGAYLRILPFSYLKAGWKENADSRVAMMLYLHPWEIDDKQPRLPANLKSRLRQYMGLKGMAARLEWLFSAYSFTSAREAFAVGSALPKLTSPHSLQPVIV